MATNVFTLLYNVIILLFLLIWSIFAHEPVNLKVDFDNQTSLPKFKVLLSGVEWFSSGAIRIRNGGETWTTNNNFMQRELSKAS